ncbi:MAG: hypothetical protein OQK12_13085 [Motiliproteus sp.]|nr:hypothetical protein [Motiliproteus sp.]MCW9053461.1 hypothetical protein [Motiliproteus sp.]
MRELAIVALGRGAQILIGLIALRVITWQLDQDQLGQYSLILTVTTLFALALINPLGMYFYRHVHEWVETGRGPAFMLLALLGCALMATVTAAVILLVYSLGLDISLAWMVALIAGSVLLVSGNNTLVPAFNILGYRVRWVVLSVTTLAFSLVISYCLMSFRPSAEYWIAGQLLGHGLMLVPVVILFHRLTSQGIGVRSPYLELSDFVNTHGRSFLKFCWPLSIAVTLNWGQFQSFKVFLAEMGTLEALGYFTASYAVCAGVMASIESVAQQYFYPKFYRDVSQASRQQCLSSWAQYAQIMIPIVTLFFMFVLCFAKPLLVVLVDQKYHDGIFFVYVAAFIEYFRVLGNIYSLCMQATKETERLILPQFLGSLAAISSVPCFILIFGVDGFSAGVILSSAFYVWLIRRTVVKDVGESRDWLGVKELGIMALIFLLIFFLIGLLELDLILSIVVLCGGGVLTLLGLYIMVKRQREIVIDAQ